jgi:hypothetical protein
MFEERRTELLDALLATEESPARAAPHVDCGAEQQA